MTDASADRLHGTVVSHNGFGCLLLGAPGTGKSRLAAEMIQLGARLVADDQVLLSMQSGMLMAAAPAPLGGILELRGIGLIKIHDFIPRHVLHLVLELNPEQAEHIPLPYTREYLGKTLPYLTIPCFPQIGAAQVLLYMKAMQEGRNLPPDWRPPA